MFDIGFFELVLVAVVALVVIGPEQLPGTLRTAGLWLGRLRRALAQTREEIGQQLGADDIRRQLHNEDVMRRLNASEAEIKRVANEVAAPVAAIASAVNPLAPAAPTEPAPAATAPVATDTPAPDSSKAP